MNKRFIPTFHATNIFSVDVSFLNKHNISILLLDLDNTLDSYKTKTPSSRVFALKELHEKAGISWYIVSNNTGKRVKEYADALGVKYLSSLRKPFSKRLLTKLSELGIDKEKVLMVGDQTVTDIACANNANIKCMLVDKLVKEDQPTTHFNRLFDRPIRKALKKQQLLKEWEEC